MPHISDLKLYNFRCYHDTHLGGANHGFNVLHGANGAGKTNILEAISLFSPGRGLRSAKNSEMQCVQASQSWAVSSTLVTQYGEIKLGTGLDAGADKRIVRIQGETVRGQAALSDHLSCVWLTPQMDRLFIDSASHRRRFFDRLVFAFDPGHSGRVTRYENAMRQRSRLLQDAAQQGRSADPAWLEGLEGQMAETGVAIAAARLEFTRSLQAAIATHERGPFPAARILPEGTPEALLLKAPAIEVEDLFKYQLKESRARDQITGGAASGPHKSDIAVFFAEKDMPAAQCSTGEQKALLIGIILAHAQLLAGERGRAPILLLDEVSAHLDQGRRAALYDLLASTDAQVWLTGTDLALFEELQGRAAFYRIDNAGIFPEDL